MSKKSKNNEEEENVEVVEVEQVEEVLAEEEVTHFVGTTVNVHGHQVKVESEIVIENGVLIKDAAGVTYLVPMPQAEEAA